MAAKKRPDNTTLFPGLERRKQEAIQQAAERDEVRSDEQQPIGRGKRVVLRPADEIEAELRAMPDDERHAILSGSHLTVVSDDLRDQIRYVALDEIVPNPDQPRRTFDVGKMDELVASIHARGVLEPILVRVASGGKYQIIAGERRWRAARRAGHTNIPAIIKTMNDADALEAALMENLQREDLDPLEEARTYKALLGNSFRTQEQLASRIGKSQTYISKLLRLLDLPEDLQVMISPPSKIDPTPTDEDVADAEAGEAGAVSIQAAENKNGGRLSAGAAIVLSRVENPAAQRRLAEIAAADTLNVRQVEALVRDWRSGTLRDRSVPQPVVPDEPASIAPVTPTNNAPTAPTSSKRPRTTAVQANSFARPEASGPQVRFQDLSVFQLYVEGNRASTVDLTRLEDALAADIAICRVLRAELEQN